MSNEDESWHPPLSTVQQIAAASTLPKWGKAAYYRKRQYKFMIKNIETLLVDTTLFPNTEGFHLDPTRDQAHVSPSYKPPVSNSSSK